MAAGTFVRWVRVLFEPRLRSTSVTRSGGETPIVFGSLPKVRRPIILILVYGIFLVLVGITATAQSVLVGAHFSTSTLNTIVGSDAATTRAFVNAYVLPRYLESGQGPTTSERHALEAELASLTRPSEILRVELRAPDGRLVASSDATEADLAGSAGDLFRGATGGASQATISDAAGEAVGAASGSSNVLLEFLPLGSNGEGPMSAEADPHTFSGATRSPPTTTASSDSMPITGILGESSETGTRGALLGKSATRSKTSKSRAGV